MSRVSSSGVLSPSVNSDTYDYLSARADTLSERFSDDDEIVWSVSSLSSSNPSVWPRSPTSSEGDFIVLSPSNRPALSGSSTGSSSPSSALDVGNGSIHLSVEDLSNRVSSLYLAPYGSPTTPRPTTSSFPHTPSILHEVSPSSPPARPPKQRPEKKHTRSSSRSSSSGSSVAKAAAAKPQQTSTSPQKSAAQPALSKKARQKAKRKAQKAAAATASPLKLQDSGLGDKAIVDDVSEAGDYGLTAAYQDAVQYVSSFLSNPSEKSAASKLRLLQAMIIELGLCPSALRTSACASTSFPSLPSLPSSLKAARALLKSNVYLNVKDYLAVRSQGLDALRRVMHPSRKSLMRDVRKGKKMPVGVVKGMGLNVLLVTCY